MTFAAAISLSAVRRPLNDYPLMFFSILCFSDDHSHDFLGVFSLSLPPLCTQPRYGYTESDKPLTRSLKSGSGQALWSGILAMRSNDIMRRAISWGLLIDVNGASFCTSRIHIQFGDDSSTSNGVPSKEICENASKTTSFFNDGRSFSSKTIGCKFAAIMISIPKIWKSSENESRTWAVRSTGRATNNLLSELKLIIGYRVGEWERWNVTNFLPESVSFNRQDAGFVKSWSAQFKFSLLMVVFVRCANFLFEFEEQSRWNFSVQNRAKPSLEM